MRIFDARMLISLTGSGNHQTRYCVLQEIDLFKVVSMIFSSIIWFYYKLLQMPKKVFMYSSIKCVEIVKINAPIKMIYN